MSDAPMDGCDVGSHGKQQDQHDQHQQQQQSSSSLLILDIDDNRVIAYEKYGERVSNWGGKTAFNAKLQKWVIQSLVPEPANVDILFSFALRAANDFPEACRLYAIAHHMHRNQPPREAPAEKIQSSGASSSVASATSAAEATPLPPSPSPQTFDLTYVNLAKVEDVFKTMSATRKKDMLRMKAVYDARGAYDETL